MDEYSKTNDINIHYLIHSDKQPGILLMHGLTGNAHAFDGLVEAGLSSQHQLISVDLRGRGLSDKPSKGYSISTHASDIISLLDELGIEKIHLGGHSFGAFLGLYLAKHYPDRVDKLLMLDAAARLHPDTKEMLVPAMGRLGQRFPSFEAYLEKIKNAPYLDFWDDAMLSYYQADIQTFKDGSVSPRSLPENMAEAATAVLSEPWLAYLLDVSHDTLLINATGVYSLGAALLPKEMALETVEMMQNCHYVEVSGNHQTMLYGEGAKQTVKAIHTFLAS